MKELRLPLPIRKDPVLSHDELRMLDNLLAAHLAWVAHTKDRGPVSEAVLRVEIHARDAQRKIRQVLDA